MRFYFWKDLVGIIVALSVITGCNSSDPKNTDNEPVTYYGFKIVTDEQAIILEEELNNFSYAILNNTSVDELEGLPAYIFDFEKMKIIETFGEREKDTLVKVGIVNLGGKTVEKYLYGMSKIDGRRLVAFQDSTLLFNINTTWQEGVILNKFHDSYVEKLLAFDSLRVFMSNLPPPPPPPLPERIE